MDKIFLNFGSQPIEIFYQIIKCWWFTLGKFPFDKIQWEREIIFTLMSKLSQCSSIISICTNLSPVCEDDAECEDAEDKETPSAGCDDQEVDGGRRTVWGGAVLHCLEVRHTWEGQRHDKHISSQANTFNRIKYNLLVPDLSLSTASHQNTQNYKGW